MEAQNNTQPITGADYLHIGTGDRYRVEATINGAVWLRRIAPGPAGGRYCTALTLFPSDFISIDAAEGMVVVLGLIQMTGSGAAPVEMPDAVVDELVSGFRGDLQDDDALGRWLANGGADQDDAGAES